MIKTILDSSKIKYCSVTDGELSHIILMLPYAPYSSYPEHCANIDAFYEASNCLYHKSVEIKSALKEAGIEIVSIGHLNLKKIAERGGLGTILNNQLLATQNYGTRITLQDITILGTFEHNPKLQVDFCSDNCRACDKACPTGALNHGVFDRVKCLRHIQDFPSEIVEEMSKRVLGCEECQNACPHNYNVRSCTMSKEIEELLDVDTLLQQIANGKKSMQKFRETYGFNYTNPSWVAKLIIYSLLSSCDYSHGDSVSAFTNHQNKEVAELARIYLTKTDIN